ncbi:ComF family protein [Pseudomonas sp. SA3-5]|uniref:ComF family protein n=1 Tax=Pseudomonas aestuarii TaxID=3018340 RepID=A0ABT4XLB5_9PSED|nr:ComF family protein [Pseudomonas aestuarii]MDA7089021.1 ComF family protein [Pseudomonas aestuarii]
MRCQPDDRLQVYNWLKNKQHCLLCDEPSDSANSLCVSCESELPWLGARCQVCALPLPHPGMTCGGCLRRPPHFDRVEAPWRYAFPVDSLISRFKHQAKWPLGRLLGELLSQHLVHSFAEGLPRPDLLLPVPLAERRQRQRGFNQAALLAQWLGKQLHLPLQQHWLQRVIDTPAQQQLDAATRKRNLRRAFALAPNSQVSGLHLALIDDVLTTGATAESLARLLKQAGAARVDIYCLARTPKPGD